MWNDEKVGNATFTVKDALEGELDFLPVIKSPVVDRGRLAAPFRAMRLPTTRAWRRARAVQDLRAGAERRGRCAASWTAFARGAPRLGRSGRKDGGRVAPPWARRG